MWRILPFLVLLPSACASVYLGTATQTTTDQRDLAGAQQDTDCSRRLWHRLGEPASIRVACRGRVVYLRGSISSAASRRALVHFVSQQPDVERVVDRLVVR